MNIYNAIYAIGTCFANCKKMSQPDAVEARPECTDEDTADDPPVLSGTSLFDEHGPAV